ncbi:hypothetical protein SUGI_0083040 [Cryptomeria japonica]|nr:hypothetical protein SUGI_0083040 [Cryptomeria japonica]
MVNLLGLAWVFMGCISLGVINVDAAPYVPAMFVSGDSVADTGNNITPYGISAFPQPSGRFSDCYMAFDYIGLR